MKKIYIWTNPDKKENVKKRNSRKILNQKETVKKTNMGKILNQKKRHETREKKREKKANMR